ncbi:MAG TPA: MFS transporter [Chloroflexota bacterium]|nr:MFS transporter [Chloroflexota bacterium]
MPREARLMLLSMFLGSLPIGLLLVFYPLYLHDLGMHSLLIGNIFTVAGIAASGLLVTIGPLADRLGRRRFLLAGTALPALGYLIFLLSTATPWLVVASILGGVGFSGGLGGGLVTATFNPILAGTVEPARRTLILAYNEVAWVAAMGLGSLLAALPSILVHAHLVASLTADRWLFVFCLMVSLGATVALLPVHERYAIRGAVIEPPRQAAGKATRTAFPLIFKLAVFFTLQGAGLGLVVQLLPLWFQLSFHTTAAAIAPWFSAAQFAGLPLIMVVPWLARRLGVAGVVLFAASSSLLFMAGMPFAGGATVAGLLYLCRSALVSMQWPAQHSFLQGAVDPRVRGTATSVTLGCWSIANALLPSLTGFLLDHHQFKTPIFLGAGCYAAAAVWFALTLRGTPLPEEEK